MKERMEAVREEKSKEGKQWVGWTRNVSRKEGRKERRKEVRC